MAMTIWNEVADMERRMDEMFRGVDWPTWFAPTRRALATRPFLPVGDIFQRGDDLVVSLELPGIDPQKDARVAVEEGQLVIEGERKHKAEVKEEHYYRMEGCYGRFHRAIPLPRDVDESRVSAEYRNGLLEVTVKGAAATKPAKGTKKVPIKVSS
jgi:HSP20 family protein